MRASWFILVILASLLAGCATDVLYLQDVNIKGPASQPPVHITNGNMEKKLRISPHISFDAGSNRTLAGQLDGHSPVDANGIYRVDTIINSNNTVSFRENAANTRPFTGRNLLWTTPSTSFGVDVDYTMSNHWALSVGTSYSTIEGNGLWGYRAGLGLYYENVTTAIRFDVGAQWQELLYNASTVIVKKMEYVLARGEMAGSGDQVGFFHDKGKSMPMDIYFAFTFNTKREDWFTNFFAQIAFSEQSLAKFKPTIVEPVLFPFPPLAVVHDERATFSSTFFVITPGVYFTFNSTFRMLVGVRINHQTQIKESSPDTKLLPFLQVDWML